MFESLDIAATGVGLAQTWLDVIANNIANVNTVRPAGQPPFREKLVEAQEIIDGPGAAGSGVAVAGIAENQTDPVRVYQPGHPYADADGIVTMPVVDLAGEMSDLIVAQRTYQLNIQVIQTSRDAYETALRIGR